MKKEKKIGLSLNKKTISKLRVQNLSGGSNYSRLCTIGATVCLCGSTDCPPGYQSECVKGTCSIH